MSRALNPSKLNAFRERIAGGDNQAPSEYYRYLKRHDVPYARLALGVVTQKGYAGNLADQYMREHYRMTHGKALPSSIRDHIMRELALADIGMRTSFLANPELRSQEYNLIAQYHYKVFDAHAQLPPTAWLGFVFQEYLPYGSWMVGLDPAHPRLSQSHYAQLARAVNEERMDSSGTVSAKNALMTMTYLWFDRDVLSEAAHYAHAHASLPERVAGLLSGEKDFTVFSQFRDDVIAPFESQDAKALLAPSYRDARSMLDSVRLGAHMHLWVQAFDYAHAVVSLHEPHGYNLLKLARDAWHYREAGNDLSVAIGFHHFVQGKFRETSHDTTSAQQALAFVLERQGFQFPEREETYHHFHRFVQERTPAWEKEHAAWHHDDVNATLAADYALAPYERAWMHGNIDAMESEMGRFMTLEEMQGMTRIWHEDWEERERANDALKWEILQDHAQGIHATQENLAKSFAHMSQRDEEHGFMDAREIERFVHHEMRQWKEYHRDDVENGLHRSHPDWTDGQVERVAGDILRAESREGHEFGWFEQDRIAERYEDRFYAENHSAPTYSDSTHYDSWQSYVSDSQEQGGGWEMGIGDSGDSGDGGYGGDGGE